MAAREPLRHATEERIPELRPELVRGRRILDLDDGGAVRFGEPIVFRPVAKAGG